MSDAQMQNLTELPDNPGALGDSKTSPPFCGLVIGGKLPQRNRTYHSDLSRLNS